MGPVGSVGELQAVQDRLCDLFDGDSTFYLCRLIFVCLLFGAIFMFKT